MNNHDHLVLRVDVGARGWRRNEVLCCWAQLLDAPLLAQQWLAALERNEEPGLDAAALARIDA